MPKSHSINDLLVVETYRLFQNDDDARHYLERLQKRRPDLSDLVEEVFREAEDNDDA